MPKPKVVVLLDTMWGGTAKVAPRWFRINPYNLSGKRLYWLTGNDPRVDLRVTNSCRETAISALHHGSPDPSWVYDNLRRLEPYDLLLICGNVAQRTFLESGYLPLRNAVVMQLKHPAARDWTAKELDSTRRKIVNVCFQR